MEMQMDNMPQQGQDPADARLWVKFETRPKQDMEATVKENRPIYVEQEWILIMVPGQQDTVERPIEYLDKQRFSKQYDHWKSTGKEVVVGTPLELWPGVTRAQVEELKYFKIRSVEDLANLADSSASQFMGMQGLKQKAKAFLEAASGNAGLKFQSALESKDAEIETLKNMVKEQSEKIEQILKSKR